MEILLIALVMAQAQPQEVFSGPQKGERTPGFKVLALNGPVEGQEVDYLAEWKGAPAAICFIHELTRPAAQLMRRLDDYGARNEKALRTLFVFLVYDPNQGERRLPATLKAINMRSPAGISVDGKEGPGAYGLNKDVTLTVLVAKDDRVLANWAIISPNETDFPPIQSALDLATAPALDTPEAMRAEILRLRAELQALRAEIEALKQAGGRPRAMEKQRGERMEEPQRPLPGRSPEDPQLTGLLRRLIRPQAEPADIDAVVKEIEALVEGRDALREELIGSIERIDALGYGTDYSKEARKKLIEKYRKR